jgi:hypothetical protein
MLVEYTTMSLSRARARLAFATLAGVSVFAVPAAAQPAASAPRGASDGPPPAAVSTVSRDPRGQLTIRASPLTERLVIDGKLDEPVYRVIQPAGDMVQIEPQPGAPATEQTDVWVFFDEKTLYVAARCWDSQPAREVVNELRRDGTNFINGEGFAVILDTFHDRRNGFVFGVNPLGGIFDSAATNERDSNRDWNTIWEGRASRSDQGWTVEMAIPFKSLRYGSGPDQVWGINARRVVKWKNEISFLSETPPSLSTAGLLKVSSAATLVGLTPPPNSRLFEIKPYAISSVTTDRTADPVISNEPDGDVGLDAKYGVTQGLTADFTYNTDFAQVENDEQQINLTRFSLFFAEKREFFLEGQGVFAFGGYAQRRNNTPGDVPVLFFSRRIGLSDDGPVPILGGGRLTGRVGPYSVGAVHIRTRKDPVSGDLPTDFSVFRIKRDILRRSSIGALFTRRSVSVAGTGSNETFGADGLFSFFQNLNINSYVARTRTPGLSGDDTSYRAQLDYNADRYGLQIERMRVDKDFNPEVGYARRNDFRRSFAMARFSPRLASSTTVRKLAWDASYDHFVNGQGRLDTREAQGTFRIDYQNSDALGVQYTDTFEYIPEAFDISDTLTIPVGSYRYRNVHTEYVLGGQHTVSGTLSYDQGGFYGGRKKTAAYSTGHIEISPNLSVEPGFSFNWLDVPQGSFVAKVVTSRITFTMSPRSFAGALIQYNAGDHALSTNVRLRWEYQPGSELFVVYSDGRNTSLGGCPQLENRSFVVKVTRFFRF